MLQTYPKLIIFSALAAALLTLTACGGGANASGRDDIAATVNGKEIKMEDLDHAIERQLKANGQPTNLAPVEAASARLQGLDSLISKEVLYEKAQAEKVAVTDPDVEQAYAQQKQQSGLSEEDWQRQMKEAGIAEQEAKDEIRKTLAINKLQQAVGSKVKNPTDKEINDFFTQHPDQFKLGKGISLSVIVADPRNNGTTDDAVGEDAAKAKIMDISAKLKTGADFATIARARSEDPSFQRSGDLDPLTEDQAKQTFGNELTARFFNMNVGDKTDPIQWHGVWAIFKLTNKRTTEQNLTIDAPQVRQQISQFLLNQRQQVLWQAEQSQAISEARIENYLAKRIVDNPDNFGSLRQSSLTTPKPADQKPAGK